MHYYPEDQSQENLKKIRRNNVCAECGRQLSIFMDFSDPERKQFVACSGQVHEGIAREYEPPLEDYRSNIRKEVKLAEEHGLETSRALATIPKQGQLTQKQAMTILKLVYPKATDDERVACAIFCRDFGLHPLANEVYLIPFKGKNVMVVGIPASRKMAHALKGEFSFLDDTPRAATEEEIVKQYGKDSEEARDNIISVTKLEGVNRNHAIGFGLYPKKESPYGMDKGNTRRNMANIRSERQAMDRLPGKPLPRYEVVDTTYADVPDVGKVNKTTGEVVEEAEAIEGEFKEVTETPPEAEPETAPEAEVKGEEEPLPTPKGLIDQEWLKETLAVLKGKGQTAYSEESLLGYMRSCYKGVKGKSVSEIASNLDKGAAAHFTKVLQDAVDKT